MVIQIKPIRILLLPALILSFMSCDKNGAEEETGTPLVIESVGISPTKAVITSDSFPEEEGFSIGLFLKAADNVSDYDGRPYSNIEYSKEAGNKSWTMTSPVMLSETAGNLYGYYPYDKSVSDIERVPVRASINGTDYMFSEPVIGLSSSRPVASILMKHALALISISFVKDASYTGQCSLTSLLLDSEGISVEGKLNLKDGTVTSTASGILFSGFSHTILPEGTTEPVLAVPVNGSDERQDVDVKCVIDGVEYNVSLHGKGQDGKGVIIKQGVHSHIKLTLKDKNLTVAGVSTEEWNVADGSSSTTGLDSNGTYNVTVVDAMPGGDMNI